MNEKKIKSALISVFDKEGLDEITGKLKSLGVKLISTGGTKDYIEKSGIEVTAVEDITGYPSILEGRVKTLHPKVFGGILARRDNASDKSELKEYGMDEIDLVIVDLYPFEKTLASGAAEDDIIEKIDIGGITLIRAAAKNWKDVAVVPSKEQYPFLINLLETQKGITTSDQRRKLALDAFQVTSHYDTAIFRYFNTPAQTDVFKYSVPVARKLRYGENPHQRGIFYGNFDDLFEQIQGKEISYNNLLDIEAAVYLIDEFTDPSFAILKHNNACGAASRPDLTEAWKLAFEADPVSAYGGIIITNRKVEGEVAGEIDKLFFEVIIAPDFGASALEILSKKKNRIILRRKDCALPQTQFRSLLNGIVEQDRDVKIESREEMKVVTRLSPAESVYDDLVFANKLVKHSKSNTIVLARDKQLIASGVGQTNRVDALKQSIEKARNFGFSTEGAVMASDAFFPFSDSVEVAYNAGIRCVIQPGGSIRDQDTIDFCNNHEMSMVFTGTRHFKH
jgi:phosphoribosylaminoimidazolecarboxamide formyltransferase / IMP cyclohydrolase